MASQPPPEVPAPGSEPSIADPGPAEIQSPGTDIDMPSPGSEPGTGDANPVGFEMPDPDRG